MTEEYPQRCTTCNGPVDPQTSRTRSTTVREGDKRIVLRHCPVCGTLLFRITRTAVSAR